MLLGLVSKWRAFSYLPCGAPPTACPHSLALSRHQDRTSTTVPWKKSSSPSVPHIPMNGYIFKFTLHSYKWDCLQCVIAPTFPWMSSTLSASHIPMNVSIYKCTHIPTYGPVSKHTYILMTGSIFNCTSHSDRQACLQVYPTFPWTGPSPSAPYIPMDRPSPRSQLQVPHGACHKET